MLNIFDLAYLEALTGSIYTRREIFFTPFPFFSQINVGFIRILIHKKSLCSKEVKNIRVLKKQGFQT